MDGLIDNTKEDRLIDELILDQKKFNDFVYTPMDEALIEVELRQKNKDLDKHVKALLTRIPKIANGKPKAVLFRNIATPNYEMRWFIDVITTSDKLDPLFLEHINDKFTNRNESKFALGKILLHKGKNKKNELIFESQNIIDINDNNCKAISSIKTFWDQSLVDFHHELFIDDFPHYKDKISNFSDWLHQKDCTAKEYYKILLLFFIKHGVLFENFMLKNNELSFTREVVLPAFIEVLRETGVKPLIVMLEPTEIEEGRFWQAYPARIKNRLDKNVKQK